MTNFLREIRSCLFVAAANLGQHRERLKIALAGTSVAILLLTLQIAFLAGVRAEATRLYDDFDFDLVLVSKSYQFFNEAGTFDQVRLMQAKAADSDVQSVYALNIDRSGWVIPDTKKRLSVLIVGLDDDTAFIRDRYLREGLGALGGSGAVLADAYSSKDFGAINVGTEAEVAGQTVHVAGLFKLGLFFYAEGAVAMRNTDFARFTRRDSHDTSLGLIRLRDGADPNKAKHFLAHTLPPDVKVMRRDELIDKEQGYFVTTKPIGIMLRISMIIAFLVGATILFQVLSTEFANRTKEFATFKAMGFAPHFVLGIGFGEALILGFGAAIPAFAASAVLLAILQAATHLPATVTLGLAFEVMTIVLAMSVVSCLIVLHRISSTDPAELYA